jgi:hypothetical protein
MTAANPLRAYASVTAAYWAFMLSDGALRMLVLLHFNGLGFRRSSWPGCSCFTNSPGSSPTLPPAGWPRASVWPPRFTPG